MSATTRSEPPAEGHGARRNRELQVANRNDLACDNPGREKKDGDSTGHREAAHDREHGPHGVAGPDVRSETGLLAVRGDRELILEGARRGEEADPDAGREDAAAEERPAGHVGVPRPRLLN